MDKAGDVCADRRCGGFWGFKFDMDMEIKLDSIEVTALQQVAKHPGERLNVGVGEMESYGLVELCDQGYLITDVGKLVLSQHLPVLMNGHNMKEPLGYYPKPKRK